MKFTITVDVSRSLAIDMLAVSLWGGAEITSRHTLTEAIKIHLSTFGEVVWPQLRGFTPQQQEIQRFKQKADALLTKHWPDFQ